LLKLIILNALQVKHKTPVRCQPSVPNWKHTFYCCVPVMNIPTSVPLCWLLVDIIGAIQIFLHYVRLNLAVIVRDLCFYPQHPGIGICQGFHSAATETYKSFW